MNSQSCVYDLTSSLIIATHANCLCASLCTYIRVDRCLCFHVYSHTSLSVKLVFINLLPIPLVYAHCHDISYVLCPCLQLLWLLLGFFWSFYRSTIMIVPVHLTPMWTNSFVCLKLSLEQVFIEYSLKLPYSLKGRIGKPFLLKSLILVVSLFLFQPKKSINSPIAKSC